MFVWYLVIEIIDENTDRRYDHIWKIFQVLPLVRVIDLRFTIMNDKIIEDNMKSSIKNCISKGVDNQEKIKKDQINNTIARKNEEEHSHIQHALYGCGVTHFSCDGVKITGKTIN